MLGNYCDDETRVILNGISTFSPSEQSEAAAYARERRDAFVAGRALAPDHWQRKLQELDPLLAARWSIELGCYVIDIWMEKWGYWHTVYECQDELGRPLRTGDIGYVLHVLASSNVQRQYGSPQDLLRAKHAQAAMTRKRQAAARTEAMKAAVDSLSQKSIRQFIDVHRAIHTGDAIHAHGPDLAALEMMSKTSAASSNTVPTGKAFNAGMHPLTYKRGPRDVDGTPIPVKEKTQ